MSDYPAVERRWSIGHRHLDDAAQAVGEIDISEDVGGALFLKLLLQLLVDLIRDRLDKERPDDGFLGEEFGDTFTMRIAGENTCL